MSKNLIVFYSWAGHTRTLAEYISQEVGGTLLSLDPVDEYCSDYDVVVERAKKELEGNIEVAVKNLPESIDEYDTIYVGSPNWWNTAAPPVFTFLNHYDFKGKTVIPFCAHGSKGCEKVNKDMTDCCSQATLVKGFGTFGKEMNENTKGDVVKWLEEQKLK